MPALRGAAGRGQAHGQGRQPARRSRRRPARSALRQVSPSSFQQHRRRRRRRQWRSTTGNRFARLEMPGRRAAVVRSDLAGVAARRQTLRNPTDADVTIPAAGFNLAGTLTTPPRRGPAAAPGDRPGRRIRTRSTATRPSPASRSSRSWPARSPQRGFIVLRYDKRGVGQSGGRIETRHAAGLRRRRRSRIVKWLAKRDDVDPRRIAVAGPQRGRRRSAMLAAAREKQDRLARARWRRPASAGADLILEQQRHQLDLLKISDAERQAEDRPAAEDAGGRDQRRRAGKASRRRSASRPTRRGSAACCSSTPPR